MVVFVGLECFTSVEKIFAASHTSSGCTLSHNKIQYTSKTEQEARDNIVNAANYYNGWTVNCLKKVYPSNVSQWCAWYVNRLAEAAGVLDVFYDNNNAGDMLQIMTQKYGATGYYTAKGYSNAKERNTTYILGNSVSWNNGNSYTPRKGDLVFFTFYNSNHKTEATVSHVGIIVDYQENGNGTATFHFIDGNNGTPYTRNYKARTFDISTGEIKESGWDGGIITAFVSPDYGNAESVKNNQQPSGNVTFTHSASSCQAQHQDVVYGTSSAADAVGRMSNIAQNYNGWYRNCFNNVGASGLGYYDYIMWYVRKLAENAGAAKIFSNSNDMAVFYKEMIEKYGAKGYYIPANCIQGYDVSPFANAAQITWAQKDIKAGDIIFVWDKGIDGSNMNFEHCYFVQRVENDVAYVTDGGVFNSAGAVKARYDKTYSSLSSTGTWISTHLVGYIRPDYAGLDRVECKHETTVIKDSRKETCGTAGYTGDTYCGSCGVLLKKGTDIKPTGNHKWNEGVVTKEATENEKGTRLFTCTVCNATKTENYEAAVKANGMRVIGDRKYWYENGERQGVKHNSDGSIDASYRGKEVYDPESDAWYWLDNVQQGAVAVNKDVYQESEAGAWGETPGTAGKTYGKWVRYDSDGHMVKGWHTTEKGTYYFDLVYGTMAKGSVTIDGKNYVFDRNTGILIYDIDDNGASFEENGWHFVNGEKYWYENGKRQGVKYNNDGSNDLSYRGKEIYDPSTDAWYWLDNILDGAVAKSKDVYQESGAGKWGDKLDANGNRIGKWVRYDENGHMVKGWQTTEAGTYYFDPVYGTMAKGEAVIDGQAYYFDVNTGVLR